MLTTRPNAVPEKSLPILIKNNHSTSNPNDSPKGEYSLKSHFFDPSKSSPPNEFMNKLHLRIHKYYFCSEVNNDDNLEIK